MFCSEDPCSGPGWRGWVTVTGPVLVYVLPVLKYIWQMAVYGVYRLYVGYGGSACELTIFINEETTLIACNYRHVMSILYVFLCKCENKYYTSTVVAVPGG